MMNGFDLNKGKIVTINGLNGYALPKFILWNLLMKLYCNMQLKTVVKNLIY